MLGESRVQFHLIRLLGDKKKKASYISLLRVTKKVTAILVRLDSSLGFEHPLVV